MRAFSAVARRLRGFFQDKLGFVEVHAQSRLSILACEDASTMSTMRWHGKMWPLPQTGQVWLEHEMLRDPAVPGFFCVGTSYRNEPDPVPGRHLPIFPVFEFQLRGGMDALRLVEMDLLEHLGYGPRGGYEMRDYRELAAHYGTEVLGNEHEARLCSRNAVGFIENFPCDTSWNMRRDGDTARKIDVVLSGQETIGSAERSCDPEEMREAFLTGSLARALFRKFGQDRVLRELGEFLSHDFAERSGGTIGVTRLIRSMRQLELVA